MSRISTTQGNDPGQGGRLRSPDGPNTQNVKICLKNWAKKYILRKSSDEYSIFDDDAIMRRVKPVMIKMAWWLSWLERRPVTAEVVGSNPIRVV